MKRKIILIYALILVLTNNIKVEASSYADEWLAKKQAQQNEYMKELEKDGNLTEEIEESITKKKTNTTKKNENNNSKSNSTIVYGTDELHIVGLPTDERGYTKTGKYEK